MKIKAYVEIGMDPRTSLLISSVIIKGMMRIISGMAIISYLRRFISKMGIQAEYNGGVASDARLTSQKQKKGTTIVSNTILSALNGPISFIPLYISWFAPEITMRFRLQAQSRRIGGLSGWIREP